MTDMDKSKEQLVDELTEIRSEVCRLRGLEVELKRAMSDLQKSEEKFSRIFHGSPNILLITRLNDGTIVDCNDSCLRITGYARDEVIGKSTRDLGTWVNPADRERFVLDLREREECLALETAFRTKDGTIIPGLISARVIELDGYSCVVSTTSDLTEFQQAEQALRESEAKFRTLFEESRDAIYLSTRDGRFADVNQATVDLFGFSREELLTKLTITDLYHHPSDRDRFIQEIERRGFVRDYEVIFRKRDGTEMPCLLTATVRYATDGAVLGYQGIIRDISRRKEMEETLKSRAEEIKLFAYSVSHDLKSPAVGVYGLTRLLRNHLEAVLDEKGRTYCDQIMRAAEQITLLAERINLFIAAKEAPVSIERVKLGEILQMLKEEFSSRINIRHIRWLAPDPAPEISADRISLLRALRNLVDNALKYGGDTLSEIEIGHRENDRFHVLSVRDNGISIKMEDSEKLFGFFQRAESSRGIAGTGLGLAIVKEIAQQHGGKVWVEPVPEGGTVFYFSLAKP
jgi:PAS domain S-box-containing protein